MSRSYFIEWFRVSIAARNYLVELVSDEKAETQLLFLHLVAVTLLSYKRTANKKGEVWVPIAAALIKEKARGASWKRLEELGLVKVKDYTFMKGMSREFLIDDKVVEKVIELTPASFEEHKGTVNLIDGKVSNRKLKSVMYDEDRNYEPKLIREAVGEIRGCLFRLRALERFVEKRKRDWKRSRKVADKCRYINDLMCLQVLYQHNPIAVNEELDLWSYDPSYSAQVSGRISHRGGGLQTCSREMKAVAYQSIENVFNYDLKASQVNGLMLQFRQFGICTEWLESYLEKEGSKVEYAARIGISEDTWKSCLYSTFMGAGSGEGGAVFRYLMEDSDEEIEEANHKLGLFLGEVKELRKGIREWHKKLWDYAVEKGKRMPDGKKYWVNAAGKSICLDDLYRDNGASCLRKFAAFVLQGQEAAFIHHLTVLSKEFGYRVVANEHDGLVTEGAIPKEAVEIAAKKSGLESARLEEKKLEPLPEALRGEEEE
jgi:hypothetical protein